MDWLSRLFEMMPVRGQLDLRCNYGAPWRIDQGPGGAERNPITRCWPAPRRWKIRRAACRYSSSPVTSCCSPAMPVTSCTMAAGSHRCRHATARPSTSRSAKISVRTNGSICYADTSPSLRRTIACCAAICRRASSCTPALTPNRGETAALLAGLVALMRSEAADDHLGGRGMLNALSTAMFTLVLRLATEMDDAPRGLLAWRAPAPGAGGGRDVQ